MTSGNGKWLNPNAAQHAQGWVGGRSLEQTFQSLSSYLGGWVDDSGRNPIVNNEQTGFGASRGNATIMSKYKLLGDECWWVGTYLFGTTTTWAAVNLQLFTPLPAHSFEFYNSVSGIGMPAFGITAYNGSHYSAFGDFGTNTAPNGGAVVTAISLAQPGVVWDATHPFTWDDNHQLKWNVRFRVLGQV